MKTCPYCAGRVADSTWTCPHCKRDLTVEGLRRYYFLVKGESKGPFTLGEVRQYATPDSMVSHGKQWLPAQEHPDFRGLRWDEDVLVPGGLEGVPHLKWVLAAVASMAVAGVIVVVASLLWLQADLERGVFVQVAPTPTPRQDDPARAASIRDHLRSTYGLPGFAPRWYESLVEIHVYGEEIEAVTDLVEPGGAADSLCKVLTRYADDFANVSAGLGTVTVRNVAGTVLAHRERNLPCRPGARRDSTLD